MNEQRVVIDGKLTYKWTGAEPLAVGERVWLPGNYMTNYSAWIGVVTALDSDYDGRLSYVKGRVDAPPCARHDVRWELDSWQIDGGSTAGWHYIRFWLDCGCLIMDGRRSAFREEMRQQRGWTIAVAGLGERTGPDGAPNGYRARALINSLDRPRRPSR